MLYSECMEHQARLDGLATPPHFTRESWHALVDEQEVGWHPRYKNLIGCLVAGSLLSSGMPLHGIVFDGMFNGIRRAVEKIAKDRSTTR